MALVRMQIKKIRKKHNVNMHNQQAKKKAKEESQTYAAEAKWTEVRSSVPRQHSVPQRHSNQRRRSERVGKK